MTQQSGAEIHSSQAAEAELPLSDRPLVADEQIQVEEQQTVVKTASQHGQAGQGDAPLNATAQEIRDRLFPPPDAPPNTERGLIIDHFEIQERIGAGGMGAVFRAVDAGLARHVALKVLHPTVAADPGLVARFRNEAQACAQLNHDNVARVFFTGEHDGVHYIAYEYAEGKTLKELILANGRLSTEDTINYAIQTTLALNHINTAGIVHRDIKPSNIILTRNGRIKVVDLGLARRDTRDSVDDLTVAGTTLGTFDYISPEQAVDPRTADIRSDIYSLGCTVYHMLTGQPPYPEGTGIQKMMHHQGKSPPEIQTFSGDVPDEVSFVVRKMMNTDADNRYQDPGQLLADLISLAGHLGLHSVPAEGIVWRRMPVRRVRELSGSVFLAGAILAICVTALVMHFSPVQSNRIATNDALEFARPGHNDAAASSPPKGAQTTEQRPLSTEQPISPEQLRGEGEAVPQPPTAGPPAGQAEMVSPAEKTQKPFRLQSVSGGGTRFRTLKDAWEKAESGAVIFLDFDGPKSVGTMPKSKGSRNIELRAAAGKHPLLRFEGGTDSSEREGQLFHLNNNVKLTIVGVDIRLDVLKPTATDQWVLFECHGPNRLDLQDSTIEVRTSVPANADVSVIRVSDTSVDVEEDAGHFIQLTNVAVRGRCDLVLAAGKTGGQINASNCAFALDGSLIRNIGGADELEVANPFNVTLEHTTSIVARPAFHMEDGGGLLNGSIQRNLPELSVEASSCLFATLSTDVVLVKSHRDIYPVAIEPVLSWNGIDNRYFGYQTYWEIASRNFNADTSPDRLDFADWLNRWTPGAETQEAAADEFDALCWLEPGQISGKTRKDLATMPLSAFELDKQRFHLESADKYRLDAEGNIPGVDIKKLRQFPK